MHLPRLPFRDIWAGDEERLRLRVNDGFASTHETFGHRRESTQNGLGLIESDHSLFELAGAELGLELWGGHPLTCQKRFSINGHGSYELPDDGVASGNCAYTFPSVPVDIRNLVNGTNAIQFSCDKGEGFWGHFIVDDMNLRLFFDRDRLDPDTLGIIDTLSVVATSTTENGHFTANLEIDGSDTHLSEVASVDYLIRGCAYDQSGGRFWVAFGWHGHSLRRSVAGHLGSSDNAPFTFAWSDADLPRQAGGVEIAPRITLKSGLQFVGKSCLLDSRAGLGHSRIYGVSRLPVPFWSRDSREKSAIIQVPESAIGSLDKAILHVRFWDGADFEGESPVTFNDEPLAILDGLAGHDLIYLTVELDKELIRAGENRFQVCSRTQRHGLEVLLPGPALQLWPKR